MVTSTRTRNRVGVCDRCRRAEIFWATTTNGKAMPIDADPVEDGNIEVLEDVDGTLTAIVYGPGALRFDPGPRFVCHFATSPRCREARPARR